MNSTVIKSLLFGFFPLLAFVVVEAYYGLEIGLYVAGALSLAELIRSYVQEKKFNTFLLVDFTLILIFGLLSLSYENPLFFKLKPAVMQFIILGFLVIIIVKPQILTSYYNRFGFNIETDKIDLMKPMLRQFSVLFLFHTLLIVYAAFYMSKASWVFISGPLFYILIGCLFLWNIYGKRVKELYWKIIYSNDEWLPIIDSDGNILYSAPRKVAHRNSKYLHPTVHIIFTKGKQIYLQKRGTDKLIFPSLWDSSVGGHVSFGETIEDALKKECSEELNISSFEFKFIKSFHISDSKQSELVYFFHGKATCEIRPNKNEVADGRYFTKSEITEMDPAEFTPHLLNDELHEIYRLTKQ